MLLPTPKELHCTVDTVTIEQVQVTLLHYSTYKHCVYAVCAKVLSANRHGRMSTNNTNFSHVFTENKATLHIGKAIIRIVYS